MSAFELELTQQLSEVKALVIRSRIVKCAGERERLLQKAKVDFADLMSDIDAFDVSPGVIGTSIDELRWLKDVIEGRMTNSMRPDDWDFLEEEDS